RRGDSHRIHAGTRRGRATRGSRRRHRARARFPRLDAALPVGHQRCTLRAEHSAEYPRGAAGADHRDQSDDDEPPPPHPRTHLRPAVGAAEGHGDAGTDGVVRPRLRCGQSGPVGSALPQRVPPGGRHDDRHRLRALTPYGHAPEGATVRPAASLRSIRPTVTSSSAAFTNRRVPATNLLAGRPAWSVPSRCPPPGETLRRCRGLSEVTYLQVSAQTVRLVVTSENEIDDTTVLGAVEEAGSVR